MLTSFGYLLKEYRLNRHMTQKELAQAIGVNGSYIARLERDERRPSRRVVTNMAQAMNLSAEDRDRLLASAQHLPEGDLARIVEHSGVSLTHPAIQAVANALQDPDLTTHGREQLENEIVAYVGFRLQQLKQQDQARIAQRASARALAAD
ncbi:MAG: helix-turn-helix transcriptional regulator [Anaerolineae bacterium]|nr:helix-turn-helix transcriptional regulator [Anaerolineae bacterium]